MMKMTAFLKQATLYRPIVLNATRYATILPSWRNANCVILLFSGLTKMLIQLKPREEMVFYLQGATAFRALQFITLRQVLRIYLLNWRIITSFWDAFVYPRARVVTHAHDIAKICFENPSYKTIVIGDYNLPGVNLSYDFFDSALTRSQKLNSFSMSLLSFNFHQHNTIRSATRSST